MPSVYTHRGAKRGRKARADMRLGLDPIPDLIGTIERLTDARVLVLDLGEEIAGAYIDRLGLQLLIVNGRDTVARQRFTLAHEFGHMFIGHGSQHDRPADFFGHVPIEIEANCFASEFLMPKAAVAAWGAEHVDGATELADVVRVSAAFGVSAQPARFTLENAGVLTDPTLIEELDAAIRDAEHVPLYAQLGLKQIDAVLLAAAEDLPRLPDCLADSALGDLLVGDISVAELAKQLDCDTAELDELMQGILLVEPAF